MPSPTGSTHTVNNDADSGLGLPSQAKPDSVSAMFDAIAPSYDKLNDWISLGMHKGWKQKACQALQLPLNAHVLDVCTGTGDLIGHLQACLGPSGRITGLDFSANMLAIAQQRFATTPNVQFVQGDAMALPFADASVDGAIVSFGLRNVANVAQVLAQMARVVKPGGWVVNLDTCPNPPLPGYQFYFNHVMPRLGRLLSNNPTAYGYLAKSTQGFYAPQQLGDLFRQAGLQAVKIQPLAFGAVSFQAGQVARPS
jgi:demethylmenaquinone methyltransferase / 2-methoxy-6-polyprenyl-1,4-benzoquinol methylase